MKLNGTPEASSPKRIPIDIDPTAKDGFWDIIVPVLKDGFQFQIRRQAIEISMLGRHLLSNVKTPGSLAMAHQMNSLKTMMKTYESSHHRVAAFSSCPDETRFIGTGPGANHLPWEDMIFEIGSVTKVFTGILLCLFIEEGKLDPKAPLSELSEKLADVPEWITPESLTSHTSGLPRIHVPVWKALLHPLPDDPYALFSREDLLQWFKTWNGKPPGAKHQHAYSNFGVGLLGEALSLQSGVPFEDLLAKRVIAPLGLQNTTASLSQDQMNRFQQPRNTKGTAVVPWTFQSMAAAGCLRSSARDLAQFSDRVIQALNAPDTPLDRAICRSTQPIVGLGHRGSMDLSAQCFGWLSERRDKESPRFFHHSGGTAGATCAVYICPEKSMSAAILSNNGLAASLWGSLKLSTSNQERQAGALFQGT